MRILLTNNTLDHHAGTEVYVRDVAQALLERGHDPLAYSRRLGHIARSLRRATVPVLDDLDCLTQPPDVIHAQHHLEAMTALARFPGTPAVYVCHGWLPDEEAPPRHPRIYRYVAVDKLVRQRLVDECGIHSSKIRLHLNFVDLQRFAPREPLPQKPARALAFSNYIAEDNCLSTLRRACAEEGIELDTIGVAAGNPVTSPEDMLSEYDIVFAKGRAAMEAMSVGAAVVLCDRAGLGALVTPDEFEHLRSYNFGVRLLRDAVTVDGIRRRLARYSVEDAEEVQRRLRAEADLDTAVDKLLALYEEVREESASFSADPTDEARALAGYLRHGPLVAGDFHRPERERLQAEAAKHAERVRETKQALHAAQQELAQARAEADESARQLAVVRDELSRMLRSVTWRLRGRVAAIPGVEFVHRLLTADGENAGRSETRRFSAPRPGDRSEKGQHLKPDRHYVAGAPVQKLAQAMIDEHGFLGVPRETFAAGGRGQLTRLLEQGLNPTSRVLDIGCGCLRVSYWLIRFLEPECYYGIEPASRRVDLGCTYLFSREELEWKRPSFHHNADFDTSVFGIEFDYFLAGSIWTHCSKRHIETTLDGFCRNTGRGGIFLASYLPAEGPNNDYLGDRWVGTSHESDVPGVVYHSPDWIFDACRSRGLEAEQLPGIDCDQQYWLRVSRDPAAVHS